MPERTSENPLGYAPTREEFEQAVRRGLGRAVLWLSRDASLADREFILYACTHSLAYDRQTENNRALYMFDVIQATRDAESYTRAVESALTEFGESEKEMDDEPSVRQMFDLLGLLAKSGDASARRSVYSFFEEFIEDSDWSRAQVLVDIDGLEGYLHVLRQWVQHPRGEDDHWYEASVLEDVEERFGAENVQAFLEKAASAEPAIGVYISEVREKQVAWHQQRASRPPRPLPDMRELRGLITDPDKHFNRPMGERAGANLSEADAKQIARDLSAETDPQRLERYLSLFRRRPFPLDPAPLLVLAEEADAKVATAARKALCVIQYPSVRALALEGVDDDPHPWELVEMLTLNFQAGDEKVIERTLQKPWNDEEMHWLGLAVRKVFEENQTPAAFDALLLFYELGFCTMCREGAVELLAEIGPLPDYILDECRYDAYDSTRELIREMGDQKQKDNGAV